MINNINCESKLKQYYEVFVYLKLQINNELLIVEINKYLNWIQRSLCILHNYESSFRTISEIEEQLRKNVHVYDDFIKNNLLREEVK